MKLLLLIHRLPFPADRGSKIRAAAELRHLARRHDVWCAGFVDSEASQAEIALGEARRMCREVLAVPLRPLVASARAAKSLILGSTATEGYFHSPELERGVLDWARSIKFDAVLAHSSSMAPLALRVPSTRRVLDLVDVDSQKWSESAAAARLPMSLVYRTEARRLAECERSWLRSFDASVVCAERERDLIPGTADRRHIHIVKTCADSEVEQALADGCLPPLPESPTVGFIGAMDYPPNIAAVCWFAEEIWPRIRARRPDACWWIVGRSPTKAVRRLDGRVGIRVTGAVRSIMESLRGMRAVVAPLRLARGVQTKVLTAMAAGRPCVVTSCVAEGIGTTGNEALLADSSEAFADSVLGLLNDRDRAEQFGRSGHDFVARHYRLSDELTRLEALLTVDGSSRQRECFTDGLIEPASAYAKLAGGMA